MVADADQEQYLVRAPGGQQRAGQAQGAGGEDVRAAQHGQRREPTAEGPAADADPGNQQAGAVPGPPVAAGGGGGCGGGGGFGTEGEGGGGGRGPTGSRGGR